MTRYFRRSLRFAMYLAVHSPTISCTTALNENGWVEQAERAPFLAVQMYHAA